MALVEEDNSGFGEASRIRDSEIQALNKDYQNELKFWAAEHQ